MVKGIMLTANDKFSLPQSLLKDIDLFCEKSKEDIPDKNFMKAA